MRSFTAALTAAKNSMASGDGWYLLFEVQADPGVEHFFVTNYPTNIEFDGLLYRPLSLRIGDWKEDTEGNLEELPITFGTVGTSISRTVDAYDGLVDAEAVVRIVNDGLLDTPAAVLEQKFTVTGCTMSQDGVMLTLGHYNLLSQIFPKTRFDRHHCRFPYKGDLCGYAGAMANCSKRLDGANGCTAHSNEAHFGGFTGIQL